MSLFDIFKPAAAPAPAAQQPGTPGNIPPSQAAAGATVSNNATAPNGVVPVAATPEAGKSPESSMDKYKEIWDTAANPDNKQGQPLFNTSKEQLLEMARNQSFTDTGITQEQLAAVVAGGEGAVGALMAIVNTASQNVYAQSAHATTKLIEGALAKSGFATTADVQKTFKQSTVGESLRSSNPAFAHPAAAPIIDAVKAQMIAKYPNASSAELTQMAQEFVLSFAEGAQGKKQETAPTVKAAEDWDKFFSPQ